MTDWNGWSQIGLGTPATYRIVVRGSLERSWSEQLGGLNICTAGEVQDPQLTILTGRLPDQAALLGVLDRLYGLGFCLVVSGISHGGKIVTENRRIFAWISLATSVVPGVGAWRLFSGASAGSQPTHLSLG
ncbi:MAG: hypothetical protein R2844_14320 [Caldilineales bacterium]